MKTKICVICGKEFTPKYCINKKTCYNKECERIYKQRYAKSRTDNIDMRRRLNDSEYIAYQYLKDNGYEPERTNKFGYPDFKCKDNTWFEIKNINSVRHFVFQRQQYDAFDNIIKSGGTVYLMIFVDNKDFILLKSVNLTVK